MNTSEIEFNKLVGSSDKSIRDTKNPRDQSELGLNTSNSVVIDRKSGQRRFRCKKTGKILFAFRDLALKTNNLPVTLPNREGLFDLAF